jgi:hypothetical protein
VCVSMCLVDGLCLALVLSSLRQRFGEVIACGAVLRFVGRRLAEHLFHEFVHVRVLLLELTWRRG